MKLEGEGLAIRKDPRLACETGYTLSSRLPFENFRFPRGPNELWPRRENRACATCLIDATVCLL